MNLDSDDIQVYVSVILTFITWAALCWSALSSLSRSRRTPEIWRVRRLVLAILPVTLGLLLFKAQILWSGQDDHFTVDLSWLFLVPCALGFLAFVTWCRAARSTRRIA